MDLGTSRELPALEAQRIEWVADVGIGVLLAPHELQPARAVAIGRAMSRTAWSYASRLAWYDPQSQQIAELPAGPVD